MPLYSHFISIFSTPSSSPPPLFDSPSSSSSSPSLPASLLPLQSNNVIHDFLLNLLQHDEKSTAILGILGGLFYDLGLRQHTKQKAIEKMRIISRTILEERTGYGGLDWKSRERLVMIWYLIWITLQASTEQETEEEAREWLYGMLKMAEGEKGPSCFNPFLSFVSFRCFPTLHLSHLFLLSPYLLQATTATIVITITTTTTTTSLK